ncbi:hypothetical protein V1L54_02955 [Streptomyces sp. TRM 70361]|uniref:hypothetical protein n=1 Tax=Streptomyces sp. TRM 70361 TaxID=3116553 RepID=UPI002E7C2A20|nr:hypothetical protein [Streptomyces sp. TRM 70361]MEE1938380.1 hypothetical protein [Streptomyces sp. TRM 70361]
MRRHLRLTAVVTVVVLALSGFSQARSSGGKGGGSRSSGGGGGGCGKDSSSSNSSSRYRGGYDSDGGSSSSGGSGGSSSASSSRKPDARVVSCLGKDGKTVVELRSRGRTDTFIVYVDFRDGTGGLVESVRTQTRLKAGQTKRVELRPEDPAATGRAEECDLRSVF